MARDDSDRRRLRALYERNRRRVSALADARDRRRGGDDDFAAPRRYVVSERRTRLEGFGRGGRQVRQVVRRARGGRADEARPLRFSDRGIFRRSGRDRFRRVDDVDREDRRERSRDQRSRRNGGGGGAVEGRRFGGARRTQLRMRGSRGGRNRGEGRCLQNNGGNNGNNQQQRQGKQGNSNRGNNNNNQQQQQQRQAKPQRARQPMVTREELDRQLDSYHN